MSLTSRLETAFQSLEAGIAHERRLDGSRVRSVSGMDAAQLVVSAREAIHAYTNACSILMALLPEVAADKGVHGVICSHASFYMARVATLNALLDALLHDADISSESEDERLTRQMSEPRQVEMKEIPKRARVAREICDTESSYLASLLKLRRLYVAPFTQRAAGESPVLSTERARMIFGNLDEIIGLSQTFLQALEAKVEAWSDAQTIGDVFLTYATFFKVYVMYTNGYEEGIQEISRLVEIDPRAREINQRAVAAGAQSASALMITPIQRLPRYVLLLKVWR